MNAFQILDKYNNPVPINQLDKEVCNLIGVESNPKYYCQLGKREDHKTEWDFLCKTSNWYDTIGWMIADTGRSFEEILEYYTESFKEFIDQVDENGVTITLEYIIPYHTKVIHYWMEKGYKTKQIIQ